MTQMVEMIKPKKIFILFNTEAKEIIFLTQVIDIGKTIFNKVMLVLLGQLIII